MFIGTKILVLRGLVSLIYTYPRSPSYSVLSIPSLYGFLPCYWPLIHLYFNKVKSYTTKNSITFNNIPIIGNPVCLFSLISLDVREARLTMGFREVRETRRCNIHRYTQCLKFIHTEWYMYILHVHIVQYITILWTQTCMSNKVHTPCTIYYILYV